MFAHNFRYTLKTIFKNKTMLFWTFSFPIILGTLFYFAFSKIESSEKFSTIPIAVVEGTSSSVNTLYKSVFTALSDKKSDTRLFDTQYVKEEKAKKLLEEDTIVGYVLLQSPPQIVVKENGINETILKYVLEEMAQTETIMQEFVKEEIKKEGVQQNIGSTENFQMLSSKIYHETLEKSLQAEETDYTLDTASSHLSYTMIEFYTLIAMTCLYGGLLGMTVLQKLLANMSVTGCRIQISPTSKGTLILSSTLASYVVQLIGIFLLFIYTIFILKVDYGPHLLFVILLALIGSLTGLALGIFIAAIIRANENTKTGILLSITMLGCFLSGMMGITMKYTVDKNLPLVNLLNPANLITDGFYALYYYDTFDRYFRNLIGLSIFAGVLLLFSFLCLRRQKYDSV